MHLIIAEKNIAANRIAQILSGKSKVSQKKEGKVNRYEFDDTAVMGLRGHVVEVDFVPGYTNWRSETNPPRSLIDAATLKKASEKGIVNQVKKLAKKAHRVTIATDFDTEGELIGKEAYELVKAANSDVPVDRAKFSAITVKEINEAFNNTCDLDFDLAAAGEARQNIDLMWGASLTRFITLAAKRGGNNILSVGRVQSPTLAMIVDREREIDNFVPEPYWELNLDTEKSGKEFAARHTHGKFWDKSEVDAAYEGTKKPLTVTGVKEGKRKDRAPTPFDTTAFIIAAGRIGLSAANAMRIAEELYMNGFISYPRTDNTIYPNSLDINGVLKALEKSPFSEQVAWVKTNRRPVPTRGKKSSTDHPPIHPTAAATREQLGDSWKVYELVVRRFLATLSPDAEWITMKLSFEAGNQTYTSTGSRLNVPGWRTVYTYSEAKDTVLPEVSVGEELPIKQLNLEEKETQPPPRFSQSKLIQMMEEYGLGTKSTRHEVIQKLISRKYIEGAPLKPTLVGRAVTDSLEAHADAITRPDMTKSLEEAMEEIQHKKQTREGVIFDSRKMLHAVFDKLEENGEQIGREIMEQTDEELTIGPCPVCGQDLRIRHVRGGSQFIGCTGYPECSFNISLPGSMWGFAVKTKDVCEIHKINHVSLISKGTRPWEMGCPFCQHINQQKEIFAHMPSMTEKMIENLMNNHIYSAYELSKMDSVNLTEKTGISKQEALKLIKEAEDVMSLLRKRSECKKFVRKLIPPKRGRSHTKVMTALHASDIDDIHDLAQADIKTLKKAGLNDTETEKVLYEAKLVVGKERMKELGIPAVSLKKYQNAGFVTPEELLEAPTPYISAVTGINIETIFKHLSGVAEKLGKPVPAKITKKQFENGKQELSKVKGLGDATIDRLYKAGIINIEDLKEADPLKASKISGISKDKIKDFKEAASAL